MLLGVPTINFLPYGFSSHAAALTFSPELLRGGTLDARDVVVLANSSARTKN